MQTHVELKSLQARLELAKTEWNEAERGKAIADAKTRESKVRVNALEEELRWFRESQDKGIVVGEHAILRYLEKVMKIDILDVRRKILTPEVLSAIHHSQDDLVPGDGFKLRIRNNFVITLVFHEDED